MDIKFIKELIAFKKEAQGNIEWLKRKLESKPHSPEFVANAMNLLGIYEDQIEQADVMIRDEID